MTIAVTGALVGICFLIHRYYDYVTPEWARQWPSEEIWVARRR